MKLFEIVCLPSLKNQTKQNFTIVMNINKQEDFYNLVKKYKEYKNILFDDEIIDYNNSNNFITTGLDSDDALNIYFVESMKKIFIKNLQLLDKDNPIIVNFAYGLQLQISNLRVAKRYYKVPSPFLSYISKNKPIYPYNGTHEQMHKKYKFINIQTKIPMWIQAIHVDNILNKFAMSKYTYICGYYNKLTNKYFKIKLI